MGYAELPDAATGLSLLHSSKAVGQVWDFQLAHVDDGDIDPIEGLDFDSGARLGEESQLQPGVGIGGLPPIF